MSCTELIAMHFGIACKEYMQCCLQYNSAWIKTTDNTFYQSIVFVLQNQTRPLQSALDRWNLSLVTVYEHWRTHATGSGLLGKSFDHCFFRKNSSFQFRSEKKKKNYLFSVFVPWIISNLCIESSVICHQLLWLLFDQHSCQ